MALLQLNLPEQIDKKVEFYKTEHGLDTKAAAIIQMLDELPFKIEIEKLPKINKNGGKK